MLPFDSQDSLRRSNLSPSQQHLVDVMQELQFGRIQSLAIRSGQPVLTEETKICEAMKLDQPAQVPCVAADYWLKKEIVTMFVKFFQIQEGLVELIEVKSGLPFRIEWVRPLERLSKTNS